MNDAQIKDAVARFMKSVSHTAQHEIEKVVRNALASGKLKLSDELSTAVTLSSDKVGLNVTIHSRIVL